MSLLEYGHQNDQGLSSDGTGSRNLDSAGLRMMRRQTRRPVRMILRSLLSSSERYLGSIRAVIGYLVLDSLLPGEGKLTRVKSVFAL